MQIADCTNENIDAEPELQIIYILTNPSMPGLLKIGRTSDLQQRVATLSSATSVPEPFEVAYAAYVDDAPFVERALHATFQPHRMSGREFFRLPVASAIAALSLAEVRRVSLTAEDDEPTNIISEIRERNRGSSLDVLRVLQLHGGTMSNGELAQAMGCSVGECSKRCRDVQDQLIMGWSGKFRTIGLKAWKATA